MIDGLVNRFSVYLCLKETYAISRLHTKGKHGDGKKNEFTFTLTVNVGHVRGSCSNIQVPYFPLLNIYIATESSVLGVLTLSSTDGKVDRLQRHGTNLSFTEI